MSDPTRDPKDYLMTAECQLVLGSRRMDLGFDLCGRFMRGIPASSTTPAESGGFVIDTVLLGARDITADLPNDVIETLTTYLNEVL